AKSKPNERAPLRAKEDGKFKIVQISDTDTWSQVSEYAKMPLIPMGRICQKATLAHLCQSALFKVVAPIIERSTPFAAVFGYHDCEGIHALTSSAHIILQNLTFNLSESGPEQVDGISNFYLQVLAPAPSQLPLSTLYFLDSHGQMQSKVHSPDYDPIKQSQIDWFTNTSQAQRRAREKNNNNNSSFHQSLAFLHIPLPEFKDCHISIGNGDRREPTESPSINSHF
ncbi:hypothetical protein ACJ72_05244, partial [Emergomyces africanus]